MKTVILNGQLGKLYGKRHRLSVATAAEAVRALVANFPSIEKYLVETKGVGYRVKLHDAPLRDIAELHHPAGKTITITPVITGAGGNGLGQLLLGAALIAAAFIMPVGAFGFGAAVLFGSTTVASLTFSIGVSMALGGIAQMISPMPKMGDPVERPENQPSYAFGGAVNTTAQGQPVPIGYGRMIIGGAVISAGITTEEIAI